MQKEKQRELSFTYNSLKSLDNVNILLKDYQISEIFVQTSEKNDRILKTNFNKYELHKNKKKLRNLNSKNKTSNSNNIINKNIKALLKINSLININTKNNNKSKKNNKNFKKNSLSGFFHKNNCHINKKKYNFPTTTGLKCFSSSANRFFPMDTCNMNLAYL